MNVEVKESTLDLADDDILFKMRSTFLQCVLAIQENGKLL